MQAYHSRGAILHTTNIVSSMAENAAQGAQRSSAGSIRSRSDSEAMETHRIGAVGDGESVGDESRDAAYFSVGNLRINAGSKSWVSCDQ
jgi:hypothetical protein